MQRGIQLDPKALSANQRCLSPAKGNLISYLKSEGKKPHKTMTLGGNGLYSATLIQNSAIWGLSSSLVSRLDQYAQNSSQQ